MDFVDTAIQYERNNSHGSLRNKTSYSFLSVSRIDTKKQEFTLTIFLPQLKDSLFIFSWSKKSELRELNYGNLSTQLTFVLIEKAIEENKKKLQQNQTKIDSSQLEGVYLRRTQNKSVGKIGLDNFRKAFGGMIPEKFIKECQKANITMYKYGENPFDFSLVELEKFLKVS